MAKQGFLHYTTPTGSTTLAPEVLGDTCAPTLALAGQQLKRNCAQRTRVTLPRCLTVYFHFRLVYIIAREAILKRREHFLITLLGNGNIFSENRLTLNETKTLNRTKSLLYLTAAFLPLNTHLSKISWAAGKKELQIANVWKQRQQIQSSLFKLYSSMRRSRSNGWSVNCDGGGALRFDDMQQRRSVGGHTADCDRRFYWRQPDDDRMKVWNEACNRNAAQRKRNIQRDWQRHEKRKRSVSGEYTRNGAMCFVGARRSGVAGRSGRHRRRHWAHFQAYVNYKCIFEPYAAQNHKQQRRVAFAFLKSLFIVLRGSFWSDVQLFVV